MCEPTATKRSPSSRTRHDDYLLGRAREFHIPEEFIEKEKKLGQAQRDNFAKAVKAGVKVAFGTDAGVYPHGENARQFAYMVKYGLTPARDPRSDLRRRRVARAVEGHRPDRAGYYADLIAVSADPLEDVKALEKVGFVMKGGKVFKDELTKK